MHFFKYMFVMVENSVRFTMILQVDKPLPPLTNAVSRLGFPRRKMAVMLTRLTILNHCCDLKWDGPEMA